MNMDNEKQFKPEMEIETGKESLHKRIKRVDEENGYNKAFQKVINTLFNDQISYYIRVKDHGVSVVHRSSGEVVYFTDIPKEIEEIEKVGLEENVIFDSKPSL